MTNFDDFSVEVTCEEVYTESGYSWNNYDLEESEPF